jgi:hypothetical protein
MMRVEAWNDRRLASAMTDGDGKFQLAVEPHLLPRISFRAYCGDRLIEDTRNSVVWSIEGGRRAATIATTMPADAESAASRAQGLRIAGRAVNSRNGFPLPGVHLRAYRKDGGEPSKGDFLGEGIVDERGRFAIRPDDRSAGSDSLRPRSRPGPAFFVLRIESTRGMEPFTSEPIPLGRAASVTLRVPIAPRPVPKAKWSEIGRRLERDRASRLNHLTSQLSMGTPSQSAFGDLDVRTRQCALLELEHAFLDPAGVLRRHGPAPEFLALSRRSALAEYRRLLEPRFENRTVRRAFGELAGKLATFHDMSEVDWVIDLNELSKGRLGAALAKFQETYEENLGGLT